MPRSEKTGAASQHWSFEDIPDQSGRIALVTGANSGIGYVTARELARQGAHVVLACRNPDRAADAAARLRGEVPTALITARNLDLADLESVRAFAEAWGNNRLDILINNAGVALVPYARTTDGFESQLGINFLGHFALTGLLLPSLRAASDARVVTVSSESQRWGRIDFTNLNAERHYHPLTAYIRSKQANVYFAVQLQRLAAAGRIPLRSMAVTPGFTSTNVLIAGNHQQAHRAWKTFVGLANRFAKPTPEGARTTLYAATVADLPGASYVAPSGPLEVYGHPTPRNGHRAMYDVNTARRLWEAAEGLTGIRFPEIVAA